MADFSSRLTILALITVHLLTIGKIQQIILANNAMQPVLPAQILLINGV